MAELRMANLKECGRREWVLYKNINPTFMWKD
jgi:hypothetical protein